MIPHFRWISTATCVSLICCAYGADDLAKPTVRIPIYTDLKVEKSVAELLNTHILSVRSELKEVSIVDNEKAIYSLHGLQVLVRPSGLRLAGQFNSRGKLDETHYGNCRGEDCPKNRIDIAFADLLHKTVFHPRRGPYAPIAVTNCDQAADKVILSLRWPKGAGLEKGFTYELAERTSHGVYTALTYLNFDDLVEDIEHHGDIRSARAIFRLTNAAVSEQCAFRSRQNRLFLLLRLMSIDSFGVQNATPTAIK